MAEGVAKAIKSFKKAHDDPESIVKGDLPGGTAAQTSTCPQCQKGITGEFAFCPHCGNKVTKA